jgi:hypothetical protein
MFLAQSLTQDVATVGQPYAASLSTNAITSPGDALAIAKVSGPAWLNVASNGTLSGTPAVADIGPNLFTVSLADTNAWFSTASLRITVVPAPLIVSLSFSQGTNLFLSWTGGQPPYQVQTTSDLGHPVWQDFNSLTTETNLPLPPSNVAAFFRIKGK